MSIVLRRLLNDTGSLRLVGEQVDERGGCEERNAGIHGVEADAEVQLEALIIWGSVHLEEAAKDEWVVMVAEEDGETDGPPNNELVEAS